jgi:hypothetical protein
MVEMACSFEAQDRKAEVVVSISRPRCSQICVGSQWLFGGSLASPRRSSRELTRLRSCKNVSMMSANYMKSSFYGSSLAPLHLELRR